MTSTQPSGTSRPAFAAAAVLLGLCAAVGMAGWAMPQQAVGGWSGGLGRIGIGAATVCLLAVVCSMALARPPQPGTWTGRAVTLIATMVMLAAGGVMLGAVAGMTPAPVPSVPRALALLLALGVAVAWLQRRGRHALVAHLQAEQQRTQRLLDASAHRLRAVTDHLPVLISYTDRDERLRFANAAFQSWLGIDPAQALGRPLCEVLGPTLYEQRRSHLQQALAGEQVQFEVESWVGDAQYCLQTLYIPDVGPDGQVAGVHGLATEITARKAVERQLSALARTDSLTGLANRYHFNERLPEAIARSQRSGKAMALMFLDVDDFNRINDRAGHAAGDAVLKEVAARVQRSVRGTDTVARLAGDEFAIILENLHGVRESQLVASKILAQINRPFRLDAHELAVTVSIGIACHLRGSVAADDLLDRADQALCGAKAAGRNRVQVEPVRSPGSLTV